MLEYSYTAALHTPPLLLARIVLTLLTDITCPGQRPDDKQHIRDKRDIKL